MFTFFISWGENVICLLQLEKNNNLTAAFFISWKKTVICQAPVGKVLAPGNQSGPRTCLYSCSEKENSAGQEWLG